jgi:DNA-directed RNA polymerase specialized sigma24 family protein
MSVRAAIEIAKQDRHPDREGALDRIIGATKTTVGSICLKWTGNRLVSKVLPDMDDVAQECRMVILGKVLRNFDPDRLDGMVEDRAMFSFCCYVSRTLGSHFLDIVRVQGRRPDTMNLSQKPTGLKSFLDSFADPATPTSEPGGLDEREIIGSLKGVLQGDDFDTLYLRYEGYTIQQIAKMKGVAGMTIRRRIRKYVIPALAARLTQSGINVPRVAHPVV